MYKNLILCMLKKELWRFKNERSRAFSIVLQPIIFLILFGLGFHDNFSVNAYEGIKYWHFFLPGILSLVILFSAIYSSITLIDDKNSGFFKYLILASGHLNAAVIAKIIASFLISFISVLLFLPILIFLPFSISFVYFIYLLCTLLLASFLFSTFGIVFALNCSTSSSFHALMSIVLIPMWLLSSAMFPMNTGFYKIISFLNPFSHVVHMLRVILLGMGEITFYNLAYLSLFFFALIIILQKSILRYRIRSYV